MDAHTAADTARRRGPRLGPILATAALSAANLAALAVICGWWTP